LSIKRAITDGEKDQKARETAFMLTGDLSKGVEPMTILEIQKALGYAKNDSIYEFKKRAIQKGFLAVDENGDPIVPEKSPAKAWKLYTDKHELGSDPYMTDWGAEQSAKKNRKGITKAKDMFQILERFFNTVRITPEMLIFNGKIDKKYVEKKRTEFMELYEKGESWMRKSRKKVGMSETLQLRLNYALVSLCSMNGITWQRGTTTMSRKIVRHGLYADIRLTKEEFQKAETYLIEKYGIDSNEYRWFWVGVETCSRIGALLDMKLDFVISKSVTKDGSERRTFFMKVFESKTQHIAGGIWKKWIKRKNTQEALERLKNRGGTRIYETSDSKALFRRKILDSMRDLFRHLGKDPDSFFFNKPSHALRHIGAHYYLSKGDYSNHVLVAKVGGWHTIDELIKSYGELPPEKVNEQLDKYDYDE